MLKYYVVLGGGVYAYHFMFQRKMLSKYGVFSSLSYPGVDANVYFTKVTIFPYGLQEMLENYIFCYISYFKMKSEAGDFSSKPSATLPSFFLPWL